MHYKEMAKRSIASQDKWELEQLLFILWPFNIERILEIGVHTGGMLQTLGQMFTGVDLYGIDTDFSQLRFHEFEQIKGDSHDPLIRNKAGAAAGHSIDFLFIDGDHTAAGVRADFEMYKGLVNPGGVIAFHDLNRMPGQIEGVEVRQFFDELKRKYPSIEIWNAGQGRDAPGIGVLFV